MKNILNVKIADASLESYLLSSKLYIVSLNVATGLW